MRADYHNLDANDIERARKSLGYCQALVISLGAAKDTLISGVKSAGKTAWNNPATTFVMLVGTTALGVNEVIYQTARDKENTAARHGHKFAAGALTNDCTKILTVGFTGLLAYKAKETFNRHYDERAVAAAVPLLSRS